MKGGIGDSFPPRVHTRSKLSDRVATLPDMDTPFIGSEALACGVLNRHRLRTRFQAICPGVYLARHVRPSLHDRIHAAWLWSHRQGIVCGLAAAALHGAKWIGEDVPVELVYANPRPPRGVKTRRDVLLDDEMHILDGLSETTPARTIFDIGRRGKVDPAVARLDALARATGLKVTDVEALAKRHSGAPGLRQLETVLDLVDAGAQSPKETWLRLLCIRSGFPQPQTQIPVLADDGLPVAYLDLGWVEWMVLSSTAAISTARTGGSTSRTFDGTRC
jgi:hypothetical protein